MKRDCTREAQPENLSHGRQKKADRATLKTQSSQSQINRRNDRLLLEPHLKRVKQCAERSGKRCRAHRKPEHCRDGVLGGHLSTVFSRPNKYGEKRYAANRMSRRAEYETLMAIVNR